MEENNQNETIDTNAITDHLPQVDQCPASLRAMPPFAKHLSPQFLLLSMILYGMKYPFVQFGSAAFVVSPPIFLHTPNVLTGRAEQECLDAAAGLLSNNQNTGVLPTLLVTNPKQDPNQHHTGCYEQNPSIPARPSAISTTYSTSFMSHSGLTLCHTSPLSTTFPLVM